MNRAVIFRGKAVKDGSWVYGNLLTSPVEPMDVIVVPGCTELEPGVTDKAFWPVVNETVGQYTGVIDCDANPVYEDDILRIRSKDAAPSEPARLALVTWDCDEAGFMLKVRRDYPCNGQKTCWLAYNYSDSDFRVIGNAWDNPSLLRDIDPDAVPLYEEVTSE